MRSKTLVEKVWKVVPMGQRPEKGVIGIEAHKYKLVKTAISGLRTTYDEYGPRRAHRSYAKTYIYLTEEPFKSITIRSEGETYLRNWAIELDLPTYNRG